MKTNQESIQHKIFKGSLILLVITTALILLFSLTGNAQNVNAKVDSLAKFTSFTGKNVNNKNYLMWTVAKQSKSGFYIIEKSESNKSFKFVGDVEGVGVPVSAAILYCFTDSMISSNTLYRVRHINYDGEILESNTLEIKVEIAGRTTMTDDHTFIYPVKKSPDYFLIKE